MSRGLVDIPNNRSSHQIVTPRGAGIVFVVLWNLALLLSFVLEGLSFRELAIFFPSALIISFLGYWDDIVQLSAKNRFIAQAIIAFLSIIMMGKVHSFHLLNETALYLGWFAVPLAIIGVIWSINLFNFMDGLDGLAGIEALFLFGMGGGLFWAFDANAMAALCGFLVFAVAGFLIWNWPKARVFMGDVGSYFLGFLVAIFALVGDVWYNIPITLWIILYGVFWFDATVTLVRRFLKKENIMSSHRSHAYQRLHQAGYTHQQVLLRVILLNSALMGIVFFAYFQPAYLGVALLVTISLLSAVYLCIEKIKPMVGSV